MEYEKNLQIRETNIPGLIVLDLPVHGDSRGWFKENWQREKMTELGLPDIRPVQNNISFNTMRGATRGIHAEPWDKYISVAYGEIFGAWVDLRPGSTFGSVFTCRLDPSKAIFVPRGVGNSFQALEDNTVYTYLVNAHWSLEQKKNYTFVNLADPELSIDWPIPLDAANLSESDRHHPLLRDVEPMKPKRTLFIGGEGQLGRFLRSYVARRRLEGCDFVDSGQFDELYRSDRQSIDWGLYEAIVDASASTAANGSNFCADCASMWELHALRSAVLARIANGHDIILVRISSDRVFEPSLVEHSEEDPVSPVDTVGQSIAAGDMAAMTAFRHYILRTGCILDENSSFLRDMVSLSRRCIDLEDGFNEIMASDARVGRLTFAKTVARVLLSLLEQGAPYGTYNVTCSGAIASEKDVIRRIFNLVRGDGEVVLPRYQNECEYADGANARSLLHCPLDLEKTESVCALPDWESELEECIHSLLLGYRSQV